MKILLYRFIYNPLINLIIRNTGLFFGNILPEKLKIPVSGIVSFRLPGGKKMRMLTNESCSATNYLFWKGGPMNYEFSNVFIEVVKNAKIFFDAGANVGYYTVLAKTCNPDVEIYSFEPANGPFYYLNENIKLNNCTKTQSFKIALSDKNGTVEFQEAIVLKYPYLKYHLNGSSGIQTDYANTKKYSVETNTLDQFVSKHGVTNLDVIKLDTERTEYLILSQARNTLEKFHPIIFCEVFEDAADNIEKEVKELNYLIFYHVNENKKLRLINHFSEITGVIDRNFVLVPPAKADWVKQFIIPA